MSRNYRVDQILSDLESGRIDEMEAKWDLQREYGSCSCMRSEIDRAVRDVDYRGSYTVGNDLDSKHDRCEREDRERREQDEYDQYHNQDRQQSGW